MSNVTFKRNQPGHYSVMADGAEIGTIYRSVDRDKETGHAFWHFGGEYRGAYIGDADSTLASLKESARVQIARIDDGNPNAWLWADVPAETPAEPEPVRLHGGMVFAPSAVDGWPEFVGYVRDATTGQTLGTVAWQTATGNLTMARQDNGATYARRADTNPVAEQIAILAHAVFPVAEPEPEPEPSRHPFYSAAELAERAARHDAERAAFAAVADARLESLTRTSVAESDTLAILENRRHTTAQRLVVAHISGSGWVDIFIDECRVASRDFLDHEPSPFVATEQRHVALTPSQFRELAATYAARFPIPDPEPEPATLANCGECGTLIIANPVGRCVKCFRASQPDFVWTRDSNRDGQPEWHLLGQSESGTCAACVYEMADGAETYVTDAPMPNRVNVFADPESARAYAERTITRLRAKAAGVEKSK